MTNLTNAQGAPVESSYAYTYDANGNRTQQIETNGGVTETTGYTYDALDRLETVTYPADATHANGRTITYGYDLVGNRVRETERDGLNVVLSDKTATFDALNRLTAIADPVQPANNATFTWDNNGNLRSKTTGGVTTTYVYDPRDKLVETREGTQVTARFQYDHEGRRTKKIGDDGLVQYVYDGTSVLEELNATGAQTAKYEWGSDRLISLTRTNEPRRYYTFDGLGSVVGLTDDAGTIVAAYHLDAWGNYRFPQELQASKNRYGFTGYLWDAETDIYYAKARYFDPNFGRFLTQDSYLGQIDDPPSLHRYFYANANPLRYIDPTGHAPSDKNERRAPTPMPAPPPPSRSGEGIAVAEQRSNASAARDDDAKRAILIKVGADAAHDGTLRGEVYEKGLAAIREEAKRRIAAGEDPKAVLDWGRATREALQNAVRDDSTPLGRAFADLTKPRGSVTTEKLLEKGIERAIEGLGRPSDKVSKWAFRTRVAGNTLIVMSAAMSAKEIYDARSEDRWRVVGQESAKTLGAIGGGAAGTAAGAKVGGAIGTAIEPGGGTLVGGAVGGVVGGLLGAVGGARASERVFEQAYEYIVPEPSPEVEQRQ